MAAEMETASRAFGTYGAIVGDTLMNKETQKEVSAYTLEKISELKKYAEEGHWTWRILGSVCGGAMVFVGSCSLLANFFSGNMFGCFSAAYIIFFGLVGIVLEMKTSIFTSSQLTMLKDEAHFLFRPYGRTLYFLFTGLFVMSRQGFFFFLVGAFSISIGVIIYVSSANVAQALRTLRATIMNEDELKELFYAFDADKSNFLDTAEFSKLCSSLGCELNHNELEVALLILDTNGDGQVSFEEFEPWWNGLADT